MSVFFILLNLRRVHVALERVLAALTADTEYLRSELEEQCRSLQILLGKMERDKVLRRDRDAVLSSFLSHEEGLGEWLTTD